MRTNCQIAVIFINVSFVGIQYLGGIFSMEITQTRFEIVISYPANTVIILVNGVVHDQNIKTISLPRIGGSIRIESSRSPFGECKYKTSTIGHKRSSASKLTVSIAVWSSLALLILTFITKPTL